MRRTSKSFASSSATTPSGEEAVSIAKPSLLSSRRRASRTSRWSSATSTRSVGEASCVFTDGGGLRLRLEVERRRVHAVALPRRLRAVVEDVAEVAAAAAAEDLRAPHHEAAVVFVRNAFGRDRLGEARPAG